MDDFAHELLTRFRWIDGHADILGILSERGFLARSAAALAEPFANAGVTKVAGIEARGFVFAAAVAMELDVGFAAIRKTGAVHPGTRCSGPPSTPSTACSSSTTGRRRAAKH